MAGFYFARPGRAGRQDVLARIPELEPLGQKAVAVFGLGCLGAPSALEFARAGVRGLSLVDHDVVDPATMGRWPFGLTASGTPKAVVLQQFIESNYPATRVRSFVRRVGAVRTDPATPSEVEALDEIVRGSSLVYDATAEWGVQSLLSDYARERGIAYVAVDATNGGWGGRICRIDPAVTRGCWSCLQMALPDGTIGPPPPGRPDDAFVQPPGCGDPTFTGAGFDMATVALGAVRIAVSTLCRGHGNGAYPATDRDVTIVALRDAQGRMIDPTFRSFPLERHPRCPRCGRGD